MDFKNCLALIMHNLALRGREDRGVKKPQKRMQMQGREK